MKTYQDVLESIFTNLNDRILERWSSGKDASPGFWRTGEVPALHPTKSEWKYGHWLANGELEDRLLGQIAVLLQADQTRVGLFLPKQIIEKYQLHYYPSLQDDISCANDGKPCQIIRHIGADILFDYHLPESVFSAQWLLTCTKDDAALAMTQNHLAWRVLHIWNSAMRCILSCRVNFLSAIIYSNNQIPSEVAEECKITIYDVYPMDGGTWLSMVGFDLQGLQDLDEAKKKETLQSIQDELGRMVPEDHFVVQLLEEKSNEK